MLDFLKKLFSPKAPPPPEAAEAPAAAARESDKTIPLRPEAAPPVWDRDATVPLSPDTIKSLPPDMQRALAGDLEMTQRLRLGIAQDVGRARNHNEDVLLAFTGELAGLEGMPSFGLFIVADGMGGHSQGERASGIAARALARSVLNRMLPSLLADPQSEIERPVLGDVLEEAMVDANQAVLAAVPEGGTTLTCALLLGEQVFVSHVGDSRAYFISGRDLERLTRDHSLVMRLQELGQITAAEAAVHPQRSVLYRAIGQSEGLEVDVTSRRLGPGDWMLLCSDGMWGLVPDEQIMEIITSASGPQAAAEALVRAANAAGGPDNITAVVVQLPA